MTGPEVGVDARADAGVGKRRLALLGDAADLKALALGDERQHVARLGAEKLLLRILGQIFEEQLTALDQAVLLTGQFFHRDVGGTDAQAGFAHGISRVQIHQLHTERSQRQPQRRESPHAVFRSAELRALPLVGRLQSEHVSEPRRIATQLSQCRSKLLGPQRRALKKSFARGLQLAGRRRHLQHKRSDRPPTQILGQLCELSVKNHVVQKNRPLLGRTRNINGAGWGRRSG